MYSVCIVTDNSVQFSNAAFYGQNIIKIISLDTVLHGEIIKSKEINLPPFASPEMSPRLLAPTVEEFKQIFSRLSKQYNEIIGIFLSSYLNDCYQNACEAVTSLRGGPKIQIMDSMTTSIGQGLMVQKAAEAIVHLGSLTDIERKVRSLMNRTYFLISTSNLSYLQYSGFIDHAQATVGEMLELLPIFTMEEGKLIPVEKKRTARHISIHFQEFIDEFDQLEHIALVQSPGSDASEARLIKDHVHDHFPGTCFSEHSLNLPLATLFGPSATALTVVESDLED